MNNKLIIIIIVITAFICTCQIKDPQIVGKLIVKSKTWASKSKLEVNNLYRKINRFSMKNKLNVIVKFLNSTMTTSYGLFENIAFTPQNLVRSLLELNIYIRENDVLGLLKDRIASIYNSILLLTDRCHILLNTLLQELVSKIIMLLGESWSSINIMYLFIIIPFVIMIRFRHMILLLFQLMGVTLCLVILTTTIIKTILHQIIIRLSYSDCYDNIKAGGIYLYINDYAYQNGICQYSGTGYFRQHIVSFVILALLFVMDMVIIYLNSTIANRRSKIPSYKNLIYYCLYHKTLGFTQIVKIIILKHLNLMMTDIQYMSVRASLVKSFKTKHKIRQVLQGLKNTMATEIKNKRIGHNYEADCRKMFKKNLKKLLSDKGIDYVDYGTKRDSNGTSMYLHHGDLRYNVKTHYPLGKTIVMVDVSEHMDDKQYSKLLIDNIDSYEYIPTPVSEWTRSARLNKGNIIYDQQVANGDQFIGELFRLNRCNSNAIYSTGFAHVTVCNIHFNVGDHHLVRHAQATAVLPIGFFEVKEPQYRDIFGLVSNDKTLVMYNGKFHLIPTKDYLSMAISTNYDRASTINNTRKVKPDNFDIEGFARDSEFSGYIKESGTLPYTYDLRYGKSVCKAKVKIPTITKTDVRIEVPTKLKDVVSLNKVLSLPPKQTPNNGNIMSSRAGPIFGSEPTKNTESGAHAYITRYLTKVSPVRYPPFIMDRAEEMISYMVSKLGKIVPSKTHLKTKHIDVVEKISHNAPKNKEDMSKCGIFTKREAYTGKVNYNRMISNTSPDIVARFTPYTAALHKLFCKSVPWYLPGKTNLSGKMFLNTVGIDYSSFESSQALPFRLVEVFCVNFFEKLHADDLLDLLMKELNTDFKFEFKTKSAHKIHLKDKNKRVYIAALCLRLSGSAWTTVGNTLVAGFLQFMYYRQVKKYTIEKSYDCIRYCYGDDSLLINGELNDFRRFASALGFNTTVEAFKGNSQLSLVGKVLTTDGKKSVDAERVLNKFLVAYGKYDYVTNLFNKWSGCYNPKLEGPPDNIFSSIGMHCYNRLIKTNRLHVDEYAGSVDTHRLNDTFERAFQGNHGKIMKQFNDKDPKSLGELEFIKLVSELLSPYISTMLPVPQKKGDIVAGIDIVRKGNFKLDHGEQVAKFNKTMCYAQKLNKILKDKGFDSFIKIKNVNKYISNLDKLLLFSGLKEENIVNRVIVKRRVHVPRHGQNKSLKLKHKAKNKTRNTFKSKIKYETKQIKKRKQSFHKKG
jgi:protein-S-isoprenylcysteine O-methyltransferase Ste14